MMNQNRILVFVVLVFGLGRGAVFAQTPSLINYQGRLVSGTNLVNATVQLDLRLYDAPVAGSLLYHDYNATVLVVDGLYSTYIGDNTTTGNLQTALASTSVWLEVSVGGTPLTPRERLASVPYARAVHALAINSGHSVTLVPAEGTNSMWSGARGSVIGGGAAHTVDDAWYAVIGGGQRNRMALFSDYSVIGGGYSNSIASQAGYSVIGGGTNNLVASSQSVVAGGQGNTIPSGAPFSSIGGGRINRMVAGANRSVIGGGENNEVGASYSIIGGGSANRIETNSFYAVVAGGILNLVSTNSPYAAIGGGIGNQIRPNSGSSVIGGGVQNLIASNAQGSAIVAGNANEIGAGATNSVITGGRENLLLGSFSFIGGGFENLVEQGYEFDGAQRSSIVGGQGNRITPDHSLAVIGGGLSNLIAISVPFVVEVGGVIGGGAFNEASGSWATVPGGRNNRARGDNSFAAGRYAYAEHVNAFVFNSANSVRASVLTNSMTMEFANGYRFFTGENLGAEIPPNGTSWSAISDRAAKENFAPIDADTILERLAALPLTAWSYKEDPNHRRYIGPVAQDFHAAFNLGDDKTINTLDADGVAFAAIQALARERDAMEEKVSVFGVRVSELEEENARLREEMETIKRRIGM